MKSISRWPGLLGSMALMAWCLAIFLAGRVGVAGAVAVRYPEGGVSPAQAVTQEAWAREDGAEGLPTVTLWEELAGQTAESGDRACPVQVVRGFGDLSRLVYSGLLYGGLPGRGDPEGCAVSSALAYELWGTVDAVGMALVWQGTAYTVRGVFEGDGARLMVQAEPESTTAMGNMLLSFGQGGSREEAMAFLNRCGWQGGQILDMPLLGWVLDALSALPAVCLALWSLARLAGRGLALRHTPALLAVYLPGASLGAWTALALSGLPPAVPGALIPTKWSDLGFWGDRLSLLLGRLGQWLEQPFTIMDSTLWPRVLASLLMSLLAVALTLGALGRLRIRTGRELLAACLAVAAIPAICGWLLRDIGSPAIPTVLLGAPAVWLLTDYSLYQHRRRLVPPEPKETGDDDKGTKALAPQAQPGQPEALAQIGRAAD